MKFSRSLCRQLPLLALLAAALALPARAEREFKTSPTLARETITLVRLLEEVHYNHENVRPADYGQIVPNFMAELDGQRLFFLASDKDKFADQYSPHWLYNNLSSLGKLEPAYDIFKTYTHRVQARIQWIFAELNKDIDLSTGETYQVDRSKLPWPATVEDADALWRKRITFEVLQDVLNKKPVEEARQTVRKRYERMLKNIEEVETNDVAEWFLSTITRLYDPHSTYFSAETYEDFGIQMRLQLVGIGALLGVEDDYCVIKEIVTGGPADLSKQLRANDKILSVSQDGGEPVDVFGMKLRKIVNLIRGQKGTKLILTIQPADASDPSVRRDVVLTRDVINLNSARARAAIFQVPDAATGKPVPIGVITLPAFYGPDNSSDSEEKTSASRDVAELIKRLEKTGIQGLVLDLRHNGGGLLSEAIELTGLFIERGPVVQVKSSYGEVKVDSDENPGVAYAGPLAVLVSKFSASASEIVAGALQDYGRAIVVGDSSTHGKGSVQTVIEMKSVVPDLARSPLKTGATKLTVQKFYLPDGHSTQLKGVVPDIILPSIDDYLPIGEKDLPKALVWDEIPSSNFQGKLLDPAVLTSLRTASIARQTKLEEFSFLKKNIEWFKAKQEQKVVSLNLEERRRQKEADAEFRKTMDKERDNLAKNDFAFAEFTLGPTPAKPLAKKKPDTAGEPTDGESQLDLIDDSDDFGKVDIHLRETLRILGDVLELGRKPHLWASDYPPLTAQVARKS